MLVLYIFCFAYFYFYFFLYIASAGEIKPTNYDAVLVKEKSTKVGISNEAMQNDHPNGDASTNL